MSEQMHDLYEREREREATDNYHRGDPYGPVLPASQNVGVHAGGVYFEGFTPYPGYSDYELLYLARQYAEMGGGWWGPLAEFLRRQAR